MKVLPELIRRTEYDSRIGCLTNAPLKESEIMDKLSREMENKLYEANQGNACDDSGRISHKTVYRQTTSRIEDLIITYNGDSIILKRDGHTLLVTADELLQVIHLGSNLRDHNKEVGQAKLENLEGIISKLKTVHDRQRQLIKDEHGV